MTRKSSKGFGYIVYSTEAKNYVVQNPDGGFDFTDDAREASVFSQESLNAVSKTFNHDITFTKVGTNKNG